MDVEHVEKVVLVAAIETKRHPRKWVVKKHGSQVGELDQKLSSKTAVFYGDRVVDEVHMTQYIGFIAAKKEVS